MSSFLFDYVRRTARDFVSHEMRKDEKSESGLLTLIVGMSLEKVQGELINSRANESLTLTVADHSEKWNLRYWLYSEKAGGFDTAINPIPLPKEAEKVLEKIRLTATLSTNVRVVEKKTVMSVYRLPNNDTSRTTLDEVYDTVISPTWGQIDESVFVRQDETKPLDQKEVAKMLKGLDGWSLESDTIAKTFELSSNSEAMKLANLITTISRQEENTAGILLNKGAVKVYLPRLALRDFDVARKIDNALKLKS